MIKAHISQGSAAFMKVTYSPDRALEKHCT